MENGQNNETGFFFVFQSHGFDPNSQGEFNNILHAQLVSKLALHEIDSPEQHNCYNYSCIISSWRFAGHTLNQISRLSFSYLILVSTYRFCSCFFVIMCMTGITTALVQMKASFMILDRPCREHWQLLPTGVCV